MSYKGKRAPTEGKEWEYVTGLFYSKDGKVLLGDDKEHVYRYMVAPSKKPNRSERDPIFILKRVRIGEKKEEEVEEEDYINLGLAK